MKRIVPIFAFLILLGGGGCVEQPTSVQSGSAQAIAVGYESTEASLLSNGYKQIPDKTIFRFIASVDIGGTADNQPSLSGNSSDNLDPEKGSPFGTYCYTSDPNEHKNIWIPCTFNSDFTFKERVAKEGQRLTPNPDRLSSVTYKITAYSPPRPTKLVYGSTVVSYGRKEFLMLSKSLFPITIDSRPMYDEANNTPSNGYEIFRLPNPFQFVEMKSKLTMAFYHEKVDFSIALDDTGKRTARINGLGVWGNLQPFTHAIKLIYDDHPDSIDAKNPNHLYDDFLIQEESPAPGDRQLRYSIAPIEVFPVNYSNEKLNKPIVIRFKISYPSSPDPEPIEIRLPINAIPSIDYLISFVVSRTKIMVTATAGSWHSIPQEPIDIGGEGGAILIGSWNVNEGVWEEVEWIESL